MARQREYTIDGMLEGDEYGSPWSEQGAYNQPSDPWNVEGPEQSGSYGTTEQSTPSGQGWAAPLPPEAPPIPVDNSSWDTDGYSAPQFTASNFGDAPSGWDPTKWANANHQTPKYVVGRILNSVGDLKDPNVRAEAIRLIQQAYPGTTFDGKDKINIPGVGVTDIFVGAGSGQYGIGWQDPYASSAPAGPPPDYSSLATAYGGIGGGFGGGGGGGVPSTASSSTSASFQSGYAPPPGVSDELWKMLMERAKQGTSVNREDPNIRSQADAYSAQEERARRNYLGEVAESSSPYGTGYMEGNKRMTAESMGQRVGNFEAQLIGREISARRDEIQHALDTMGSLMTEQQRMALQQELAQMSDAMDRLRIETQNRQFYSGLSQADRHFADQLAQTGRLASMDDAFRRSQLSQQQNQFLDEMGFKTREQDNYWDWRQRGND